MHAVEPSIVNQNYEDYVHRQDEIQEKVWMCQNEISNS
jgi:hypothetical protein